MPKLSWKLLTKKRGSSTQGLPPGKEDLAWVTNTVTLIYGERDAVLVDTFLSIQHSKELVDWLAEQREESHDHLCHARPRRPFLRAEAPARQVSWRKSVRYCFLCCCNAKADKS